MKSSSGSAGEYWRADGPRSREQTSDIAGTARPPRRCWRRPFIEKASERRLVANPWISSRHRSRRRDGHRRIESAIQTGDRQRLSGRHDLGKRDAGTWQVHRDARIRSQETASSLSRSEDPGNSLDVVEGMHSIGLVTSSPTSSPIPQAQEVCSRIRHLIHEKRSAHEGPPVLGQVARWAVLRIIAEDVEGEALATLWSTSGAVPSQAAAQGARFGDRLRQCSKISRRLTGGRAITERPWHQLENIRSKLGKAKKVTIDKDTRRSSKAPAIRRTSRPRQADPHADRGNNVRLRPRDAAGGGSPSLSAAWPSSRSAQPPNE